ncbi:MAG: DUF6514 family protein, partial [Eubacteriales bacterium]
SGDEESDYYIPDISDSKTKASELLSLMHRNAVLPSEIEELFSDGITELF